jgi:RNA polymerase sigma-54 factor
MTTLESTLEMTPKLQHSFSPLLMRANHILNLSQFDLEALIAEEIDDNPALELDECPTCPHCGRRLVNGSCATCLVEAGDLVLSHRPSDDYDPFDRPITARTREESEFDPLTVVAGAADVRDQIAMAARASLPEGEQAIAVFLIDALDDRGFLSCDLADVAAMVGRPLAAVEAVLAVIQEIAPSGVAARDLRECLLLQVRSLRLDGVAVPAAVEPVIESHLENLAAKRLSKIADALRVSLEEVEAAREFIRTQLTPHPLQARQIQSWSSPSEATYVAPDVIVTLDGEEIKVEAPNAVYDRLRTNSLYRQIARTGTAAAEASTAAEPAVSGEAVAHTRAYVAQAQQFIWSIRQRRQTLLRVAEFVCRYQEAFLRGDERALRPLTRGTVAAELGVHESTVSRAVANKYVMLPSRRVVPFSDFFTPSLSVKHVIQQMIQTEANHGRPLSDAQISERLLEQGIRIARRTVAKYRGQLHILPSTVR